ncbi:hypothetical protein Mal48_05840 [Thalassoglobus polymorphus]|uniref:Uncharacterized protein n=1 Tax=Thalassoglobus polymorphus TaxID=2527994 RepID=A0A517QI94_9PLAN|nr:hypothetical protein Mal48_05840 [Thalassoglobus polymorphus]
MVRIGRVVLVMMNLSCHGCANRAVRSDRSCWTLSYRRMLHLLSHGSQRPWHAIRSKQGHPASEGAATFRVNDDRSQLCWVTRISN